MKVDGGAAGAEGLGVTVEVMLGVLLVALDGEPPALGAALGPPTMAGARAKPPIAIAATTMAHQATRRLAVINCPTRLIQGL